MKSTLQAIRCITLIFALIFTALASAQVEDFKSYDPKRREKAANKLGDTGDRAYIAPLAELTKDPVADVRSAAVAAIIKISTLESLPPLQEATRDAMPEIQAMAVDGLVNFYYPGYVKFGWINSLKSFGGALKDRFREPELIIVDPYVEVREEVIRSIAAVISGGSSMDSRANAARAVGILRGKAAMPELLEGLQSRNSTVIIESMRSMEKIGDVSVGPKLVPYLRDLDDKVQISAIEAVGQLRVREAVDELVSLAQGARKKEIRRSALISLAKIPDSGQKSVFGVYLIDRDDQMRAAAAEGIGRNGDESDLKRIKDAFAQEKNESARLSMAFAAVKLGDAKMVSYLVEGLNSTFHRGEARPFLIEAARDEEVLNELYAPLLVGTPDQKKELATVISISGTRDSVEHLERLSHDPDPKIAQEAIRAMKNLQARL